MCGIIGIIGDKPVSDRMLYGLRRLEYRGYDSAGIAICNGEQILRRRAAGKLFNLEKAVDEDPADGQRGIGHTRWATHGAPNETNAHPHVSGRVAVVHNGSIEYFKELRAELREAGRTIETETDTEVVAHLIDSFLKANYPPKEAVQAALDKLRGAYALVILIEGDEEHLYAARKGSPLVIGHGHKEMYLGSDAIALAHLTSQVTYLEEGDWLILARAGAAIFDGNGKPVTRRKSTSGITNALIDKGNYRHFMLKEIYEQPQVVSQTLSHYIAPNTEALKAQSLPFDFAGIARISIIACGTSYYAGMIARYWVEQLARVSVEVDIASEFRYRDPVLSPGDMALFISQSGETSDTLEAVRHAKAAEQNCLAIVNVPESSMEREAGTVFPTKAGPEVGVASTKAFTCQLAVLAALSGLVAKAKGHLDAAEEAELVAAMQHLPAVMNRALKDDPHLEAVAQEIAKARDVLYLGRGQDFPIALEGALKLKEISYIHAEGYAAGEMKHGPIALIDEDVPVIVVAPSGPLFEKTVSNMQEVIARGAKVVLISDKAGLEQVDDALLERIEMPMTHPMLQPLVSAIYVQLIAYHAAVAKGTDVDQPRNLAKAVTVE
ncbi:MAG: glutamine--fructose-6-phosphate transaminase (isomerizing) [Sphingomonadales bacterium]